MFQQTVVMSDKSRARSIDLTRLAGPCCDDGERACSMTGVEAIYEEKNGLSKGRRRGSFFFAWGLAQVARSDASPLASGEVELVTGSMMNYVKSKISKKGEMVLRHASVHTAPTYVHMIRKVS